MNNWQLNDDAIDSIVLDLFDWIIGNPLILDPDYEDEACDQLHEFVWQLLGKFSNGERNWN